jgi:hypothetical protein
MTKKPNGEWDIQFETTSTFEEGMIHTAMERNIPNAIHVGVPPIHVR